MIGTGLSDAAPGQALPTLRYEAHFGDRVVRCFAARPSSLDEMFCASVARFPQHEAIVYQDRCWTYSQLDHEVSQVAAGIRGEGIGRGDRVAMLVGNRPEFIIALLAIQRLRAIAVPISTREQAPGIEYLLTHCGARMLIHDAEVAARVPLPAALPHGLIRVALDGGGGDGVEVNRWRRWQVETQRLDAMASVVAPASTPDSEEDTAIILYTSGTTGRPKGAMLSHFNIIHSALHYEFCMGLTAADRSAMAVPASHVTGLVAMIMTMLRVGGAVVIVAAFRASSFLALAAAQRITHTILVPAMYQLCLLEPELGDMDLDAWRIGAYGGAPMSQTAIEALANKLPGLTLMNAYGATETTSPTTIMPAGLQAAHLASVGRPVPCADVKVMDDLGREVVAGETGELWIGGPMVVKGYWDDAQATARAFAGGYWRSGDLGSIDAEGFVQVVDRKKDMLDRGGYKVYSVEVENTLLGCDGVIEAAVVGRPCPVLGQRVHAAVCVDEALGRDLAATESLLRAHCAAQLADYKVPETWMIRTDPLPRNANGKLLKRALPP